MKAATHTHNSWTEIKDVREVHIGFWAVNRRRAAPVKRDARRDDGGRKELPWTDEEIEVNEGFRAPQVLLEERL